MKRLSLYIIIVFTFLACEDPKVDEGRSLTHIDFSPTVFTPEITETFPILEIPSDNDLTYEKIELGQHLFYDPILSIDSTMACASCHHPESAFTDNEATSPGVDGIRGNRSSMSLVNVGFNYTGLFWDGRVNTLEEQALLPVEDPIELHNNWPGLMTKLKNHDWYPEMFRAAFGVSNTEEMTKEMAAKALAQFQRVIISSNSKLDLWTLGLEAMTDEEFAGYEMFFEKDDATDSECFHCHAYPLMTTNEYLNNGIEETVGLDDFPDLGHGPVIDNREFNGTFRVPTLRNITLTAPYMHDGRFETLREVIDHYDSGGHSSPFTPAEIHPLGLTEEEKDNLEAFLHTLVDTSYLSKEYIKNPFN